MALDVGAFEILFLLLAGHALADFGLQTEFIARFKSHREKLDIGNGKGADFIWVHVLISHSLLHGLAVFLILGNLWLALAETVAHTIIDFLKSEGLFGFHTDQLIHISCKFAWWIVWLKFLH
jgi:hypothetical protein